MISVLRMIKAIIFDFDGVIAKSNFPGAYVLEKLLADNGIKKSVKDLFPHFGEPPKQILQEMLHRRHVERIMKEYTKIMTSDDYVRKVKLVRGAKHAIVNLKKRYRVSVASGAIRPSLLKVMKHTGVKKYFPVTLSANDVRHGKPHPEILMKAMKKLKAKKNEAVYVCDAPNDVIAARRAGIKSIVVLTGVLDRKTAERMKADFIIRDITKLGALLRKPNRQMQFASS